MFLWGGKPFLAGGVAELRNRQPAGHLRVTTTPPRSNREQAYRAWPACSSSMARFVGGTLVTNGVADLTLEVRREPYRIRLLKGADSRTQHLTWSTGQNTLTAIATDGTLLPIAIESGSMIATGWETGSDQTWISTRRWPTP